MSKQVNVRVIQEKQSYKPLNLITKYDDISKSDHSEELDESYNLSADTWIPHPVLMEGLKRLVDESTILPQCIKAYRNNITGYGIGIRYIDDQKETPEMEAEFDRAQKIVELLSMEQPTKEVFEDIIEARETYGIAYAEVIRNLGGEPVELNFIEDTPSIDMTVPLEPFMETTYFHRGEAISRRKKFRKFRQNLGGKTVYFKEFGDPRIMDKRDGEYKNRLDDPNDAANELITFRLGASPYGCVRWIGQVLTIDGNRKAEILNNAYFTQGRHTPLMIVVKGGTLSDESFEKLQNYMDSIKGEAGQHKFLVLETDSNSTTVDLGSTEATPQVEIKDLASILQKDELFQEYEANGRKKVQSAFLLPDLYVGYTTDFNRATAQTSREVTEQQVFQPERESLAWVINHKLLNEYAFQYVEVFFEEPDISNPDDLFRLVNVANNAGGVTPNMAHDLAKKAMGEESEPYDTTWGDTPLVILQMQQAIQQATMATQDALRKAADSGDTDIIPVLQEIRKALSEKAEEWKS